MIKRIEQYLLTNYPTVWNIRLVPIALLVVAIQIIFFTLGYFLTNSSLNESSFLSNSYYLVYAGSVLVSILIFIFWIIQYNRNNGLKAHYPQSNISLYLEWIMIFAICAIICFIPNSLSLGKTKKWENTVSKQEYQEATHILTKARALMPSQRYRFELGASQTPLMVGDAKVDRSKFDTKLYTYIEDAEKPEPIEYIGPSLLYFKGNGNAYYWKYKEENILADVDQVHQWLVNQEKDSIRAAMQDFIDLHKKHGVKTNTDADYWMSAVYNPPLYPIDLKKNEIMENDYSVSNHVTDKYTQFNKISSYYDEAGENYEEDGFQHWYIVVTLTIAMGLSVMVYSGRVTSGRSWIFALLSNGVLTFASSLLVGLVAIIATISASASVAALLVTPIFWIGVLIAIGFAVTLKVVNGKKKGKSNIYVNMGLWLIPTIIFLLYYIFTTLAPVLDNVYNFNSGDIFYALLIVNIVFTLIVMFPITILLRKWKALPED